MCIRDRSTAIHKLWQKYDSYWKYVVQEDQYGNLTLDIDTDVFRPPRKKSIPDDTLFGVKEENMPYHFWRGN